MSLATLAFPPQPKQVAVPLQAPPDPRLARPRMPTAPAAPPSKPAGFDVLTRYIPTETITLYVAAMAAREQIAQVAGLTPGNAVTLVYNVFALLTPLILVLLMLVAHRQAGGGDRFKPRAWPLFAALAGFLVWALSVPGHPVADQLAGLPALGALLVSTFLSLLDPLFAPQPDA